MTPFATIKIAHVGITFLGGLFVLRFFANKRSAESSPGLRADALFAVVALLAIEFFCAVLAQNLLELSGFGLIHLIYLDAFLTLPVLGAVLWARHLLRIADWRMTGPASALALLALCTPAVAYYGTWVEPFDLRLEQHTVRMREGRGGPAATPFTIAVIADLQAREVTDYERRAISLAMASEPDLILIAGDVIHWSEVDEYIAAIPEFRELLSNLHAPGGVYFVQGNTDIPELESALFEGTDIVVLRDQIANLDINGSRVTLGGLALGHHHNPIGQSMMRSLETAEDNGDIRILLCHLPDAVLNLQRDSRVDLVIAGHTHGGQVQIPFFGPPLTLSNVPRSIAAGGLSRYQGNSIYVSRGIGVERDQAPRVRFLAPPEVSVLTIDPTPLQGLN